MSWHEHVDVSPVKSFSASSLCLMVTWPYHRTLRYFTLRPAERLARSLESGSMQQLADSINHWQRARAQELDFVCKASTVAAAATIGIFSWNDMDNDNSYWLARAFLYFSLSLSLWAVITSAQQFSVIHAFPPYTHHHHTAAVILRRRRGHRPLKQRSFAELNMLYVWQCPLMLMSYAWGSLLLALTLHVCSPLISDDGDDGKKVAYFYLGTGLALLLNFVWSSAWVYWTAPDDHLDDDMEVRVTEKQQQRDEETLASPLSTASTLTRATTSRTMTPSGRPVTVEEKFRRSSYWV